MFPHTHLFCAKKILPDASPLTLYGSVFPDFPVLKVVPFDRMLRETPQWMESMKDDAVLKEFSLGLGLHEHPYGIDRFVHGHDGFAFAHGRKLFPILRSHIQEKELPIVSHDFIEFAVESLLLRQHPALQKEILGAVLAGSDVSSQVTNSIVSFFGTNHLMTPIAVKTYNKLLEFDASAEKTEFLLYNAFLAAEHGQIFLPNQVSEILEQAKGIVKRDYEDFLSDAITKCKKGLPHSRL
jgi:hypothetical protein